MDLDAIEPLRESGGQRVYDRGNAAVRRYGLDRIPRLQIRHFGLGNDGFYRDFWVREVHPTHARIAGEIHFPFIFAC